MSKTIELLSHSFNRLLAKLGSGEFTPTIGEAEAITSDAFCKMSKCNPQFTYPKG